MQNEGKMGQFDALFEEEQPIKAPPAAAATSAAANTSPPPVAEEPGPAPYRPLDIRDGKGNYQAWMAPRHERREWFEIAPRFHNSFTQAPEWFKYDFVTSMFYSPAGDMFAIVYTDRVLLFRGAGLRPILNNLADRKVECIQEFDPTLHRPLEDDPCIVQAIEVYPRNAPGSMPADVAAAVAPAAAKKKPERSPEEKLAHLTANRLAKELAKIIAPALAAPAPTDEKEPEKK